MNPRAAKPAPDHPSAGRSPAWFGLLWVSPWLFGFLAFLLLPAALSLYYSFTDYSILEKPLWIGAENYINLMDDPDFWIVMRNTLVYTFVSVPLGTIVALLIAVLLNQKVRFLGLWRVCVFMPTLVPVAAAAMVWMWLFNGEFGLINVALLAVSNALGLGLEPPNWLGSAAWAMPAIIFMSLWGVGGAVVIYLAALQDVPHELYEAAALDGMSGPARFLNVTVPMISPVILFNAIIALIGSWNVFVVPYIMTGGGPDKATYFYTMYLYDNAFRFGPRMGYASALAWIQLLIVLALTAMTFWLSRRFVHYRA